MPANQNPTSKTDYQVRLTKTKTNQSKPTNQNQPIETNQPRPTIKNQLLAALTPQAEGE